MKYTENHFFVQYKLRDVNGFLELHQSKEEVDKIVYKYSLYSKWFTAVSGESEDIYEYEHWYLLDQCSTKKMFSVYSYKSYRSLNFYSLDKQDYEASLASVKKMNNLFTKIKI